MDDPVAALTVEKIKDAWNCVPYPGDSNIFSPHSYDDEDITEYFRGTTWEEHSAKSLLEHSSAISTFFTPAAYHYWLPAFLIAAIEYPEELDAGLDNLLSSLFPEKIGSILHAEQQERFALLTNEQKLAIISTLDFIIEKGETKQSQMYDEKSVLQFFYSITERA